MMGTKTKPKVLLDIEDCVLGLKTVSASENIPINDDCTTLHRFEEKLELILSFGLIDKTGLLGTKKSYWHYICACFASCKRSHDGINFAKSQTTIKTPVGRGRAFIRFCLTEKCLADTLQSCFIDQKTSREFYSDRSLPLQEKLWSALVTSLYELNELSFDLCAGHAELDVTWPRFAWKCFTKAGAENFPPRNMSSPNLNVYASQDEFSSSKENSDSASCDIYPYSNDSTKNCDVVQLTEHDVKLPQLNKSLQEEVECLKNEKIKLQYDIQELQKQYLSLHHHFDKPCENQNVTSTVTSVLKDDVENSVVTAEKKSATVNGHKENLDMHLSPTVDSSVKSKLISDISGSSSECALQHNDSEMSVKEILNSDGCTKDMETSLIRKNILQNPIYVNELLLEIKTVVDDIEDTIQKSDGTLAIPHISRLKRIRICLGDIFSSDVDKSNSHLNFNSFVENCISCIKNFITKQEGIISSVEEKVDLSIKGNQNMYSKIRTLKELLWSYGFLKVTNEKEVEPENPMLPLVASPVLSKFSCEDFSCDISHDPMLKRILVPLLPVLNSSVTKLSSLNEKMAELQFCLESSLELNSYLISRVQDQEMHLKGVTKEIEEVQQFVSVLKSQHRKLQSAEGILKYDLQEKRKLLTKLKEQLENTREDFNLVRIKNSKSEAEWQDLHKEFTERHKQASEESGFVDDKGFEEQDSALSNSACCYPMESTEKDTVSKNSTENLQDSKKKRLALLEEQCQSFYSSLLQSAKKREEINKKLEVMCKVIENNKEQIHSNAQVPSDLAKENNFANENGAVSPNLEGNCQNIFTSDTFTNTPLSTSDVGSLNSECSSCIPSICNDINLSDSSYCDSSKVDSHISFSSCQLESGAIEPKSATELVKESDSLHNSECTSSCMSEYKEGDDMISSCESIKSTEDNDQILELQTVPHVHSILMKKKDLEESLKSLKIADQSASSGVKELSAEEFDKQICSLQNEKMHLLTSMQELEKRISVLSTELEKTSQQLMLSKAAKKHEVAALNFQLNSEALKYERALKEFSEQSKGLENMKQRVTEQERLILALEEALSEIHSDRESEKEQRWQELEDIHIALEAREQECITLCQELEKSMSEVEEEHNKNEILLSQLEQLKAHNQKDRENMQAEVINLKQYSRELQKKLVKLLKEKDILWKRNDHMHHLQRVKIDDRWMNDSEVSSCLACKNNFSFILRKHHCRLCGRIFCYSCANNWLMTASSRRKIRTCNECFVLHMEMKNVVRRGSDVPQVDDDTEDEAERDNQAMYPMAVNSCSFTSDVSSSMTNSVMSLPIIQGHSTPYFASAPDLRYVHKPNEASSCSVSLMDENLAVKEEDVQFTDDLTEDLENKTEPSSDQCSPVTPVVPKSNRMMEISVELDIIGSVCGVSGQLVALPGEIIELPVLCQNCPVMLEWKYSSNYKDVPITITYDPESCDINSTIFYQTSEKMQDQIELCMPGYYVFHFDNSFRDAELNVKYSLTADYLN